MMTRNSQNPKNHAEIIILVTCLFSIGYAILRYHILGPVPWKDLSFFILNKGISLSGFILLTFNFSLGPLKNLGLNLSEGILNSRKLLGMTGFVLILVHALMSFMLFKQENYPQFFLENGTLTLFAGLSMIGGIIAFVILWGYNMSFLTHLREDVLFIELITSRRFMLVAMLFSLIHLFFMGFEGWMASEKWHGGLPPISLIAFVFFSLMYLINLFGRR